MDGWAGRRDNKTSTLWFRRQQVQMKLRFFVVLVALLVAGCDRFERLDEKVFYDGPEFKLKLVRYYESLFLHFSGEVYSVQCQSAATMNMKSRSKREDDGWRMITTGAALGSTSAQEIIDTVGGNYLVVDEQTFVELRNGLSVTFDACGSIQGWYPTELPIELIDQVEKPDHCAPKGTGDCRHYDFMGDRAAHIDAVTIDGSGHISFVVQSKAFKDQAAFLISSVDFGRSWHHERIDNR